MLETTDPSLLSAGIRMIWGLLVVLGIILILYRILRKKFSLGHGNADAKIKIIEIRHIMPKKTICLVAVGDQQFLLGLGTDTINLLSPISTQDEESFTETLASVVDRNEE